MPSFKNTQGITCIRLFRNTHNFCPMGNDWYTARVEVVFYPNDVVMDYCEVDDFFKGLDGQSLIIEDVVSAAFDYFNGFNPHDLCVEAKVDDATHLPVEVIKKMPR